MRFFVVILMILTATGIAKGDGAFVYAAIGRSWTAGLAYNKSSPLEAQELALNQCRSNHGGRHCIFRTAFKNTCLALAVQQNNSGAAWITSDDMNVASQQALEACRKYGTTCVIKASLCDGAPLTINTEPGLKYLIKLVSSVNGHVAPIQIFVNGGQSYSTKVQLGGKEDLFGPDTSFFASEPRTASSRRFNLAKRATG